MGGGLVLTAGGTLAVGGGNPQVRRAGVNDDSELLRGCSNGDVTHVDQLQGEGGSGLVQNWLRSIPALMTPSGVTYLLRQLSNHRAAHRLWSQRYLHLMYYFPVLHCMQNIDSMTRH